MSAGVYMIYCWGNGKAYIGSSSNMSRRLANHRHYLRSGKHGNAHLQRAWDRYGEDSFSMGVLHVCSAAEKLIAEQVWLDIWCQSGMSFNRRTDATSPLGVKWTDEERAAKSAAMKANPPFAGRKHSETTRAMLSESAKLRTGSDNPFFGKRHTVETKRKISEANSGHTRNIGRICSEKCRAAVVESNKRRRGVPRPRRPAPDV